MAPLPKRRHSSSRQAQRTRALKVSGVTLVKCKQCHSLYQPHHICPKCGYYNEKAVILKKERKEKK